MAMTYFHSGEADAPVLDGQAGSLVALLDAVLVNGYSSGATERQPLGWEIAFSDTDRRAYRMSGGSQRILYVDDTAQGAANDEAALVRGYDDMTGIDAGTGPFPDGENKFFIKRENGSGESDWVVVGSDSFIYFASKFDQDSVFGYEVHGFGDLEIEPYMDGVVVTALFGFGRNDPAWPEGCIFGDEAEPWMYPRADGTAQSASGSMIAMNDTLNAQDSAFSSSPTRGLSLMFVPIFVRRGGEYSGKVPDCLYSIIRTADSQNMVKEVTNVAGHEGERFLFINTCIDSGPTNTTTAYRLES